MVIDGKQRANKTGGEDDNTMRFNLQRFAEGTGDAVDVSRITCEGKPVFTGVDEDEAIGEDGDGEVENDDEVTGAIPDETTFYMPRLLATDQNLPHTEVGEMVVRDDEGNLIGVTVSKDGTVTESLFQVSEENIEDGSITASKLADGSITARQIDLEDFFDSNTLKGMIAENIDAGALFENEEFLNGFEEECRRLAPGAPIEEDSLDAVTTPGRYHCPVAEAANAITDKPEAESAGFSLDVIPMSGESGEGGLRQIFREKEKTWIRHATNGEPLSWGDWVLQTDNTQLIEAISGEMDGNAATATKLKTARTIGISGGATGTATSFNGSGNITIPVTGLDMSKATAGTLATGRGGTGRTDGKAVALATARTIGISGGATGTATGFDGSGNISIPVTGLDMSKATAGTLAIGRGGTGRTDGKAVALATARTINGVNFDGSANITIPRLEPIIVNGTTDMNTFSYANGHKNVWVESQTSGACASMLNLPMTNVAFTCHIFSPRTVSTTDYVTVQTYTNMNKQVYQRWCVSGTWTSWVLIETNGVPATATKLATARTIGISGGATGTAMSFDGSGNISIPVTGLDMSKATAGTLATGRGGTGRTDGKAVALATARTISLSGGVKGSTSFDGSTNVSIATTLDLGGARTGRLAIVNGGTDATSKNEALRKLGLACITLYTKATFSHADRTYYQEQWTLERNGDSSVYTTWTNAGYIAGIKMNSEGFYQISLNLHWSQSALPARGQATIFISNNVTNLPASTTAFPSQGVLPNVGGCYQYNREGSDTNTTASISMCIYIPAGYYVIPYGYLTGNAKALKEGRLSIVRLGGA